MGRPRKYKDAAAKQRAWREREARRIATMSYCAECDGIFKPRDSQPFVCTGCGADTDEDRKRIAELEAEIAAKCANEKSVQEAIQEVYGILETAGIYYEPNVLDPKCEYKPCSWQLSHKIHMLVAQRDAARAALKEGDDGE